MSAEYNFRFRIDWNVPRFDLDLTAGYIGQVKVLGIPVVGSPTQAQIDAAVAAYIEEHPGSLSPLSPAVKAALLQIAEKVAYIDEDGEDYYDALDAALNAKALLQITAVFTQGSAVIYDTDTLDSLKQYLVVTAYYDDGTSADVTNLCTLSGSMAEGTNTITATYSGKTATFQVTTVQKILYTLDNSGFDICGMASAYQISGAPHPYTSKVTNRLTYWAFDLMVEGGKTYRADFTGSEPNAQVTVGFYTQVYLDAVNAHQNAPSSGAGYEDGWHDGVGFYEVTPPVSVNGSPIVCCRITLRKDTTNPTITTNFLQTLTLREMPTE